ncbi:MAG: DUF456 domain-containing protein [Planctomycetota bacterium]|nr:MAG: DUF456 domain-containing protein [Planctomycetota bacterium]
MSIALAILLVCLLVALWSLNLVSLPGNWLAAGVTSGYWLLEVGEGRTAIAGGVVVLVILLAALAELVEFLAGALGATKAGGSKLAAVLALLGSIAGALTGAAVGSVLLPIPIVGTVVGALLLGALGSLMGAILGETALGRSSDESWNVGKAAFFGRLLGTLAKSMIGAVAVAVVAVAVCF